jgi:hypothetical protein
MNIAAAVVVGALTLSVFVGGQVSGPVTTVAAVDFNRFGVSRSKWPGSVQRVEVQRTIVSAASSSTSALVRPERFRTRKL